MALSLAFCMLLTSGCASAPEGGQSRATLSDAIAQGGRTGNPEGRSPGTLSGKRDDEWVPASAEMQVERPIATVNGTPVPSRRIVELLLASHGVGLLEQLVVLESAERLAKEKGITVTDRDVAAERDRALRTLIDPLSAISGGVFDVDEAQRVLSRLLAERNISQDEFDLVLRRNALLRAIVLADRKFSNDELQAEYDRAYGETVTVRHMQLASLADAARIRERLLDGEQFEALASTYSVNVASRRRGGLLDPFTRSDDRVPEALRAAAFDLTPGTVSSPVRVGEWYHLLRLEKKEDANPVPLESCRDELQRRLQDRVAEPAMRALYEKLFEDATITIHDPVLQRAFGRAHPDRPR